jgi:hypothetical protein
MNEDEMVPQLLAYRHKDRFKAYCTFCDCWHHWRSLGLVDGKCPVFTPNSGQVVLIDGGMWHPSMVVRYSNRKL